MGKWNNTLVLDQALNYVINNATRLSVCNAQPTDYTTATATNMLAIQTISSANFTGPTTGDSGGQSRKITLAAQLGISITSTGTATYVAISDSVNSRLLYVTTCTSQALTSGGSVDVPAITIEIQGAS